LERRGRDPRLRAGAAVHAAAPGNERLDRVPHLGHHRRAGGVVEIDVAALGPVVAGNLHFVAEEVWMRDHRTVTLPHPRWRFLGFRLRPELRLPTDVRDACAPFSASDPARPPDLP